MNYKYGHMKELYVYNLLNNKFGGTFILSNGSKGPSDIRINDKNKKPKYDIQVKATRPQTKRTNSISLKEQKN